MRIYKALKLCDRFLLLDTIEEEQKLIISAPYIIWKGTESLLIEYILQKNNFELNNTNFIVPTNSLIEELYIKLLQ